MDVLMPQLGETVAEGKISKWFVKAGDSIQPGQNLFEIETDKVSMEVPAIAAGTLAAIHVAAGEVAPVGAVVAIIQGKGESISLEKPAAPLTPAKAGVQSPAKKEAELDSRFRGNERSVAATAMQTTARQMEPFREVRSPERNYGPARLPGGAVVTPLARRLAGEAGIDLSKIKGSGPHGRIVAADIAGAKKAPAPAASAAANILLTADVALTAALALCADVKDIELTDVVVKAWAMALQRVAPSDTAAIALTAGEPRTTISGAATKSLTAISAARRESNDAPASSAISIPGVPGITSVSDLLRPPQTTLLSLGAPHRVPVEAAGGSVTFVSVMTATLSCDAQALDAARGAALLAAFKGFVEKPVTMIV
jgi:pyruvate/2-oxoglutarate dehydrogenase complex dihydrolipoamide acyltransferase (E2) component